ncbi:ATP-binding protein [Nonomuraea sp. NPDC050536]|uniref:ATP-binding protein n=1 Tax=Nonomuraea sp. NPDC050536 TaxID=3364366 RepID=UPI0037CA52C5
MALRGREAELGLLHRLADGVTSIGAAAFALVRGEPGIGKTSLLGSVVEYGAAAGFAVARGKAEDLDAVAPLSTLISSLRPLLPASAPADLSIRYDQRLWLVEQLAGYLEARALEAPVLVSVDDVQWADQLSLFALRVLPARLRSSPLLWLLASRDEHGGPASEIATAVARDMPVDQILLGPLSGGAMAQIAADILGAPADAGTAELLLGAGGSPFLAVELLTAMAAHSPLAPIPAEPVRAAMPPTEIAAGLAHELIHALPERLVAGVRGRLESLPARTLRLLQIGAVLGRRFAVADAAELCGHKPSELLDALEAAVRGGLLDDDGDQLVFRHDLLRQAVYAGIPASARKAVHRQAADLLASSHRVAEAAYHVLESAVPGDEGAIALLRRAADDALALMPDLATYYVTGALELASRAGTLRFEVGEQAITVLGRAGRDRDAVGLGDGLLAQDPPAGVAGRLEAALGGSLWSLSQAAELQRRTGEALARGGASPQVEARLEALHALALSRSADLAEAGRAGEAALARARAVDDRRARITSLLALGEIALNAGDCREALARFAELRGADPAFTLEEIFALQHVDDLAAGGALLAGMRDDAQRRPLMLAWVRANQSLGLGRLDDADADLVTLERLEDDLMETVHGVSARVQRGWVARLRGDVDGAHACLEQAKKTLAGKQDAGDQAAVAFLEAVLAGDPALLRLVAGPVTRWRLLRGWLAPAVRLALRAGDRALAEDLAGQAARYAARNPDVPSATGQAAQAAGLVRAEPESLRHAVALLERGPRPLLLADARTDLGQVLLSHGDKQQAISELRQAAEDFTRLGAYGEAARAQGHLDAAGAGRRKAPRRVRPVQGWGALTPMERKVAVLIAEGHTNRSAAAELFISPHTVNTHLTSIFRKLSVTSRVQLARVVMAEHTPGLSP